MAGDDAGKRTCMVKLSSRAHTFWNGWLRPAGERAEEYAA
jgi:hypothetical protein